MKTKTQDLNIFLNKNIQVHIKTSSIHPSEDGESMMSNIYQGKVIRLSDNFLFMGAIIDEDKIEVTAAILIDDIVLITLADDVDDLLPEREGMH